MTSQFPASLVERCQEAVTLLDRALQLPALQVGKEVDEVEQVVVRLRDALIHQLRDQTTSSASPRLREALSCTNAALSLIVGVEYPAAGIQRSAIEQARHALAQLLGKGLLAQD